MDCLYRTFCCGSTNFEPDESYKLVDRERRPRIESTNPLTYTAQATNTKLPKIHLTNVSDLFESKLDACSTTPVPSLGSYGLPFPQMVSVHIFQDTESSLKIVSFQSKPFDQVDSSINLHHVIYPNYNVRGDEGEMTARKININEIEVNGESRPDIKGQKVIVHDGRFSPQLEPLVYLVDGESNVVSATIKVPKLDSTHLYHGIKEIRMLNVVLPEQLLMKLNYDLPIDAIYGLINPVISRQIMNFLDK